MHKVKGMVLVRGATYRIVRVRPGFYEVYRLLDDARVGTFHVGPPMAVAPCQGDVETVREVARMAVLQARTSWVRLDARDLVDPRSSGS